MQWTYESRVRGKKQITYIHEADQRLGVALDDLPANFEGFPLAFAKWIPFGSERIASHFNEFDQGVKQ